MKKSVVKRISLSFACLLGVSTLVTIANMYNKAPEAVDAYYQPTLKYDDIYTNRSAKQLGEYEWTGNCVGNTGFKYYKGSYFLLNKGESLSITWHNTEHKLVNYFVVDDINFGTDSDSGTTEGMSYVATVSSPGFTSYTKTMSNTGNFWNGFLFQNGRIVGRYGSDPYYDPNAENEFTTNDITLTFTSTSNQRGRLIFRENQRMYPYAYGKINFILRSDDGKTTYGQKETMYGEEMTPLEDDLIPTKEGSTFLGYYSKVNDYVTGEYDKKYYNADGTGACTNDITGTYYSNTKYLYAKWRGAPYTITFNNNGGDGPESVIAYYDEDMPEITLPTKTHYTFTGYWDSEDESGTKYYNADGSSAHVWDKEADTILYAHFEASISVLDIGTTEYTWDGDSHSYEYIKFKDDATEVEITDYTIKFSTDEGTTYTSDTKPEFSSPGVYTIYYEVNKTGYATLHGEVAVTINKADASMTPPDAREELVYDGNPKYLTTKGYTDDGTIMYNIDGGEWQTERPEVTNAGTYTVGYKVIGDANHNDTEPQYVPVTIAKADYETSVSLAGWSYGETPNSPSVSNNPESGAVTYEYKEKSAAEETYSSTVPTNAGEYTVRATIAATTNYKQEVATTDFTISKVDPTQVDPTGKTDLVYTGSAQDLINAGSSIDGTMKYKLGDNGVYSEDVPSAINVGDYTVYYKLFGDQNHEDSAEQSLVVNIAKAQAVLTAPTGKSGLHYTGEDQVLINAGSSTFGEVLYKVNDGEYSTSLPIGKNVGNYTIYYKVESTDNYDGVAEASITVSITENNKDALVNTINNADSYHDNIKEKYGIFANDVQDAINEANEVKNNPNVTEAEIAKAIEELNNAISKAQNDVAKVEETIETINKIGDVKYDSECQDAINAAREIYDSLTDEQKNQLGKDYINKLINDETKYASVKKTADILFIVLLIVSSLALIGGISFLIVLAKKRKNDDENDKNGGSKKEPVKAMSIGGFLPFVILTSNYLKMPWIIVYIIAGLAILVWISVLIVAIVKKNKKQAVSQKSNQIQSEVKSIETKLVESSKNEDEEEVETIRDEKGNIFQIRFIKSFTAKLIQSPEETKKYYEELKNEVLSYKKTNSRVSWHHDAVNAGREYVLKFAVRGKTLCVYLPLNADDYVDSKYKVEKAESKRYEDVPCLYRIKNDRRLVYAKELIAVVASNLGLEKGEEQHEVYSNLPYEPNKPLIERGLIKEQKIQVNKPATEPAILETKTNSDGEEVVISKDSNGNIFQIRFIKSFTAKLIQSPEETKKYYEELKNEVLSYKNTHSRVSWHHDAVNAGREYVLKFAVRGKTLCVYLPLDPEKLEEKYKVERSESKRFEDVPCLYRIKNDRRLGYAKELIAMVASNLGLEKGEEQHEVYSNLPYEPNKPLIERGLIKEQKVQINKPSEVVIDTKVDEEGDETVTTVDNAGQQYEIRYLKSFTAKLSQTDEKIKDFYNELKNYALSFKGSSSRVSWNYDSISVGRKPALKFVMKRKNLAIYYALDTSKIGQKYKVEKVEYKKYKDVPCMYLILDERRKELAKALIDRIMRHFKCEKGEELNDDYRVPFESKEALLKKGLIREVRTIK